MDAFDVRDTDVRRKTKLRCRALVMRLFAAVASLALVACGGDDPNAVPTAVIASLPVVPAGASVTLDATGSSDADGDRLTYAWVLTSKPAGSASALIDATAARPSFAPDRAGTYSVSLTVGDGADMSPAATMDVVVADPLVPTKVVALGSTSRTVSQHAPVDDAFQVRVTNVFGDPVSGVAVTFALGAENPARPPLVQTTLQDGTVSVGAVRGVPRPWSWIDFFHVSGRHRIVASATGVAPVAFDIDVTPSPHDYDGVYTCDSSPSEFKITNGSVSRTDAFAFDQITGQVDAGSGALQVTQISSSDLHRYLATAQIAIDSLRNARAQGTRQSSYGAQPVELVDWSCSRF